MVQHNQGAGSIFCSTIRFTLLWKGLAMPRNIFHMLGLQKLKFLPAYQQALMNGRLKCKQESLLSG